MACRTVPSIATDVVRLARKPMEHAFEIADAAGAASAMMRRTLLHRSVTSAKPGRKQADMKRPPLAGRPKSREETPKQGGRPEPTAR